MAWQVIAVTLTLLVHAELSTCISDWEKIADSASELLSEDRSPYGNMLAYSGHWVNDMGRFHKCKQMDNTQYVVLAVARRPWVVFAACGPDSCTKSDYYSLLNSAFNIPIVTAAKQAQDPIASLRPKLSAISLSSITVYFPFEYIDDHSTIHGGAVAMLVIIILLLVVCFTGTIIDLYLTHNSVIPISQTDTSDKSTISTSTISDNHHPLLIRVFLSFSFYTNFTKLMQPTASRSGENISVLNGLRVLSIGWVILGHVYGYRISSSPIINLQDLPEIIDKPKFAIVYGAFYAVDTFFWMGGFLLAYLLVKEIKAKKRLNWFMVYFHRFWRLVPLFMFVTFLVWAFQGYGQEGPLWFEEDESSAGCADYWWTNLIFLNNFLPNGKRSYCLAVSWYMSNDMQFYIITPVIIYVYVKFQRAYGWIAIALLCMISVITAWEVAAQYDMNMVLVAPDNSDYMYYYYVKPYCRVVTYALGLASGFIVCEVKQQEKSGVIWDGIAYYAGKVVNHKIGAWISFVFGLFLVTLLIFVQYNVWKQGDLSFSSWSKAQNIQFIAWNRLAYGVGLSCLLLPIILGHIKPAEWFLSLPIWSPFAKLTFSVYLIHLSIVTRFSQSTPSAYYVSDLNILMDLIMFVLLSYFVAVFITLTVESPMMALEKVLFHPKPKGKPSSS